jgi:hypothetical protein
MTALTPWLTFYEIVGASAGALIGLQFVVMALIANLPQTRAMGPGGATFVTPTVIHFCAALLLAGMMTAPWFGVAPVAILLGVMGIAGVVYTVFVARRMRHTVSAYRPEPEDWLFHVALPVVAYTAIVASACTGRYLWGFALFAVAAAALLLLFIGIHNAWDIVTYHVFVKREKDAAQD